MSPNESSNVIINFMLIVKLICNLVGAVLTEFKSLKDIKSSNCLKSNIVSKGNIILPI